VPAGNDTVSALYVQYRGVVYARCLSLLKNEAAAEDATQEVFLKFASAERSIDAPLAYLLQSATNHCLNLQRGPARQQPVDIQSDEGEAVVADRAHRVTGANEARDLSRKVLEGLGTVSRAIALAVFSRDEEKQEVASQLGISRKTVTRKLARIAERARALLGRPPHDQ
jgi:RNA polymerase sigma-70 factor (ECF subfamily)